MIESATSINSLSNKIFTHIKKNVVTNTFLSSFEYQSEIDMQSLFYAEFAESNNLYIFRKRKNHIILNYYINDLSNIEVEFEKITNEFKDVRIVIEIPYKEDEKPVSLIEHLGSVGFLEKLNRIKLEKTVQPNNEVDLLPEYANLSNRDVVDQILLKCFNEYTGCIPNQIVIEKRILAKEIIVQEDESGKIVGLLEYGNDAKCTIVKHLAVLEEYRQKGLAKKMLDCLINISNKKVCTWTSINSDAESLYKKMGFEESNYKSIVLIK